MSVLFAALASSVLTTAIWLAIWRRAACDLAHEVRRPMTALLIVAEGLRGQLEEGEFDALALQVERASQLLSGSDWASQTWSRLLKRRDADYENSVDLLEGIIRAWRPVARRLGLHIHFEDVIAGGEVRDPQAFNQSLSNLLANALEHGHGDVIVSAESSQDGLLKLAVVNAPGKSAGWAGQSQRRGRGRRIAGASVRRSGGTLKHWTRDSQAARIDLPVLGGRK